MADLAALHSAGARARFVAARARLGTTNEERDKIDTVWNVEKIMEVLPHRYPMLLVDRIVKLEPMKSSVGIKCVTMNEAFFQGHFPGLPVMPGVLIVEAMAQVGACMVLASEEHRGKVPLFGAIDSVKFRKPVVPGDCLLIETEVLWFRSDVGRIKCRALVDDKEVCIAEVTCKLFRKERA